MDFQVTLKYGDRALRLPLTLHISCIMRAIGVDFTSD
jgi:hypothetical protein